MRHLQMILIGLLLFAIKNETAAQCNPDTTLPIAVCDIGLTTMLGPSGEVTLWASDFDDGSYDDCTDVNLFIEEGLPPSPTPPSTENLVFDTNDIGMHDIVLWVADSSGNDNTCIASLEIQACQSTPNVACNDLVNVSLDMNGEATLTPDIILEGGPYCNPMEIELGTSNSPPGTSSIQIDTTNIGISTVTVWDAVTGNSCWGQIDVEWFFGDCNPDTEAPVAVCDQSTVVSLTSNDSATVFAQTFDDGSYDNCSLSLFVEHAPASATPPSSQSITYTIDDLEAQQQGTQHLAVLWTVDNAGNTNLCMIEVEVKCNLTPALVCNNLINVSLDQNNMATVTSDMVLEGSPTLYQCADSLLMTLSQPPTNWSENIQLDASHIGSQFYTVSAWVDGQSVSSCWGELNIQGSVSCVNDTIPPVAYCHANVQVNVFPDNPVPHVAALYHFDIDAGSFDGCTNDLTFLLDADVAALPTPPGGLTNQLNFTLADTGLHDVVLYVADTSSNWSYCEMIVEVVAPSCDTPDLIEPDCEAPAAVTISQVTFDILGLDPSDPNSFNTFFGEAQAWDNCGIDNITSTINITDGACGISTISRVFMAIDDAGNTAFCGQTISLTREWSIHIPADRDIDDTVTDSLTVLSGTGLIAVSYEDIELTDCNNNVNKIIRTWTVYDWCGDISVPLVNLPKLDMDGDGETGDGYDILGQPDSIYLLGSNQPNDLLTPYGAGFTYTQIILFNDTSTYSVTGTVFDDESSDCAMDMNENSLAGWEVVLNGLVTGDYQSTVTDSLGNYEFQVCEQDTLIEISLNVPFNYGISCPTTHTVTGSTGGGSISQNIPVQFDNMCPILHVDVSALYLRRCFDNTYVVNYCNYSDATIDDVRIEVQLDPNMVYNSSTAPQTDLGGNLYSFEIGNLNSGQCGQFNIEFLLECDAVFNATHCVEAHIYPDTLCPQSNMWTGANIEVDGYCQNDSIFLKVTNTGAAAMSGPLEYIVVEDVMMLQGDVFDLGSGDTHTLNPIPADGATYRLEAEQEPGHPFPGSVATAIEGCNGINLFGLVNFFPLENPNPFIANDCQQNRSSFDPNDKQVFPVGYQEEHLIEQNTDIEYMIRFQNTGTDTAFTVRILDELDPSLDPTSIRPGASSHQYQFELINGNTVRFTFNNIMLPDSNVNESASHGFVQFNISQKADLPLGTVIENDADIYFDFNDPIATNSVFHTIGDHFIQVDTDERPNQLGQIKAFPNPSAGDVMFEIPTEQITNAVFTLHDALGQQVVVDKFNTNKYRFEKGTLAPGIYFYKIEVEGFGLYTGKVILEK